MLRAMLKSTTRLVLVVFAMVGLTAVMGCATKGVRMNSSITMMALNSVQPFASKSFARRMALLIIEDRYPTSIFSPKGAGMVEDGGDVWRVTFDNALVHDADNKRIAMVDGAIVPKKLTFVIRKNNAAVVDIQ